MRRNIQLELERPNLIRCSPVVALIRLVQAICRLRRLPQIKNESGRGELRKQAIKTNLETGNPGIQERKQSDFWIPGSILLGCVAFERAELHDFGRAKVSLVCD